MTPVEEKNKRLCDGCDGCCKHVAVEIDAPEEQSDYDHIAWYLLHENVRVFMDHDGDWFVEFLTKCQVLDENKLCTLYGERPGICRGYSQEDCVRGSPEDGEFISFNTREDFLAFLKLKKIDYVPGKE